MRVDRSPAEVPLLERVVALVTSFGLAALVVLTVLDRRGDLDLTMPLAVALAAATLLGMAAVWWLRRRRLLARRPTRTLALRDQNVQRRRRDLRADRRR